MKFECINRILELEKTESTQLAARELIKENPSGNILILAGEQTAGYGRRGTPWSSGMGGLYFTLITRTETSGEALVSMSLKTAEAVKETLAFYGVKSRIKPPNDVYAAFKEKYLKISGIIIETIPSEKGGSYVLFGVGINLNNSLPKNLPEAVSLKKITGEETSREKFLYEFFKIFWDKLSVCRCSIG